MIFRGPFADVAIPEIAVTPFVFQNAKERSDKPALIDGPTGRTITFAALQKSIAQVAASLARRGFKKGEVFGILSPNVPEYAVVFHAVACLGGINSPVNPQYTEHEIAHQLKDAGARFLVTVPQCFEKAAAAGREANIEELFVFDKAGAEAGEVDGATPFSSLLESDGDFPTVPINPREDLVALPYSSGTTGLPKRVMLTHRNLVANILQSTVQQPVTSDDTLVGVLPLFHIYGLSVVMNAVLRNGATLVTMPRFDLEGYLALVQQH